MSTKHLVHPELLAGLAAFPNLELDAERLAALRAGGLMAQAGGPDVPEVEVSERMIAGPEGAPDVRLLLYRPKTPGHSRPAILHIHGGGYVLGSPEISDAGNRLMARDLDCVVASVDYRLAPDTVFPGNIEDCYAALRWMHGQAGDLGVNVRRIAVKGESAGGGLAAALALLARDRGEFPLAFQLLVYPMIDDRTPDAPHAFVGEFIWTRKSNHFGWSSILGREPGGDDISPYAAAARASDLSGLPPTFIAVGALDLFLEENLEYARRLTRAGVATELHVYPGAYHGFPMFPQNSITRRFERDCMEALKEALGAPPAP